MDLNQREVGQPCLRQTLKYFEKDNATRKYINEKAFRTTVLMNIKIFVFHFKEMFFKRQTLE